MNTKFIIPGVFILSSLAAPAVAAQGASQHLGQSITHTVNASGHLVVGSAKLSSGVVAVPLLSVGAIGAVSNDMGEALMDVANEPIGEPLPVTDEIITVTPLPRDAVYGGKQQ